MGLCHCVQGTAERLAGFVGVPHEEVAYWVAGINHQAWFLQLRHGTYRGEDLYPRLLAALDDPEVYDQDRVRFEVMRHFGYFVTESSRHMSEYVPWFRRTRRTGALDAASSPAGCSRATRRRRAAGRRALRAAAVWDSIKQQIAGEAPIDFTRSREYCSYIVTPWSRTRRFRFNGNVPNTGLITNLPAGLQRGGADPARTGPGCTPAYVGDLPAQLAAINRTNVNVQELAVQGFLDRDRDADPARPAPLDPLAAATTSLRRHPFDGGRAVRGQRALAGRLRGARRRRRPGV